jgi:hypothetical protein
VDAVELGHPLLVALVHQALGVVDMLEVARRRDQRQDRLEDGSARDKATAPSAIVLPPLTAVWTYIGSSQSVDVEAMPLAGVGALREGKRGGGRVGVARSPVRVGRAQPKLEVESRSTVTSFSLELSHQLRAMSDSQPSTSVASDAKLAVRTQLKAASKPKRAPQQSKNLRGRPTDPLPTRVSKTLAFLLRHGADKEGLAIRPDGYLLVDELVRSPSLIAAGDERELTSPSDRPIFRAARAPLAQAQRRRPRPAEANRRV